MVNHSDWLSLDHLVEFVEERGVIRVDRVELLARHRDEFHLGWIVCCSERIRLQAVTEHLSCSIGFSIDKEAAKDQEVGLTWGSSHEYIVGHDGRVVIVAQNHVPAACTPVRPRRAHVNNESEPCIVDRARSAARRDLDNSWTIPVEVQQHGGVHRVGVACQEQTIRIKQLIGNHSLVARIETQRLKPNDHCLH